MCVLFSARRRVSIIAFVSEGSGLKCVTFHGPAFCLLVTKWKRPKRLIGDCSWNFDQSKGKWRHSFDRGSVLAAWFLPNLIRQNIHLDVRTRKKNLQNMILTLLSSIFE